MLRRRLCTSKVAGKAGSGEKEEEGEVGRKQIELICAAKHYPQSSPLFGPKAYFAASAPVRRAWSPSLGPVIIAMSSYLVMPATERTEVGGGGCRIYTCESQTSAAAAIRAVVQKSRE